MLKASPIGFMQQNESLWLQINPKTSNNDILGKRIKKLRKKYGYTQEKLSELTNIDYKYIQRIEGKNPPAIKIDTIERLANALKIKLSELFDF